MPGCRLGTTSEPSAIRSGQSCQKSVKQSTAFSCSGCRVADTHTWRRSSQGLVVNSQIHGQAPAHPFQYLSTLCSRPGYAILEAIHDSMAITCTRRRQFARQIAWAFEHFIEPAGGPLCSLWHTLHQGCNSTSSVELVALDESTQREAHLMEWPSTGQGAKLFLFTSRTKRADQGSAKDKSPLSRVDKRRAPRNTCVYCPTCCAPPPPPPPHPRHSPPPRLSPPLHPRQMLWKEPPEAP